MTIYYYFTKGYLYKIVFLGHFDSRILCLFLTFLSNLFKFIKLDYISIFFNEDIPIISFKNKDVLNNKYILFLIMNFFNKCFDINKDNSKIVLIYK